MVWAAQGETGLLPTHPVLFKCSQEFLFSTKTSCYGFLNIQFPWVKCTSEGQQGSPGQAFKNCVVEIFGPAGEGVGSGGRIKALLTPGYCTVAVSGHGTWVPSPSRYTETRRRLESPLKRILQVLQVEH